MSLRRWWRPKIELKGEYVLGLYSRPLGTKHSVEQPPATCILPFNEHKKDNFVKLSDKEPELRCVAFYFGQLTQPQCFLHD